ncbi:MAG: metal ABC transporter permease [Planctomycetota bacterium]|jgi:ABC-type Mn2+/Zn2+ transport system permease subunit/Mn-dependent DtxR family transcriptional regulator
MGSGSLIPAFDFYDHIVRPWSADFQITVWVMGMGIFVGVACGLLGCFLVLRGKALLGDAISHALLAGLAGAFLLSGSRGASAMIIGAVLAGVATVVFIELIHRHTRVKEDASIAVVFSTLFALGVVLITRFTEGIDLDAHCVLYGEIESSWLRTDRVWTMGIVALSMTIGIMVFYKELKISSFDPATATAMGISAGVVHYVLMTAVSISVVCGMEAVGAILVVTMLIAPGATAFLLTDKLCRMLLIAAVCGAGSAVLGYHLALWLDCSTAGAISLVATMLFVGALAFGPQHGVIMRAVRRSRLSGKIARENLLSAIYKLLPAPSLEAAVASSALCEHLRVLPKELGRTCRRLQRAGWIVSDEEGQVQLTERGLGLARRIVRSHRLWETYLVNRMGITADHAHPDAEEIEHLLSEKLLDRLDEVLEHPEEDPHGQQIPRLSELLHPGTQTRLSRLREGDVARVIGIAPSVGDEVIEHIGELNLPLGEPLDVGKRTEEGLWTVRLPDGSVREVAHESADALIMELTGPVTGA